jgi:hypothetical protein
MLWKVSRLGSPRSTILATATKEDAKPAQRQPPLMAYARTDPAVHIVGRVGPSCVCAWASASGVSRMPVRAIVRSATRKRLVQRAAPATLGSVTSVQTVITARKATATQGRSNLPRVNTKRSTA